MIKVIEIENALERINGDIFQEFCNHYLYIKLNPNSITPIGSVIGKEKSRKGIPDSYFTVNNKLIFAEYTTRERLKTGESFYNKLKSDIKNCFDTSKTGLKEDEIDKIILCFTERIKPDEKKKLEELCKIHNPKCVLDLIGIRDLAYAVLDFPYLGRYIGIPIDTGQIQAPSEFIANYEKSKISTPLSNSFFGRDKELEEGLNYLNTNSILLVFGSAGTGKSKFSIELAKRYSDKNAYTFLCIGNNGISIWDDLKTSIKKDKNYIILVDDANRLTQNFQLLLSLLKDRETNNLKIIATVRDYALQQVKAIANTYQYSSIEINTFSNDEIEKIIKSDDFKINEPSYVDRILKISKGNARLAIMCAKVAIKANNILELYDVSQIYDEYFDPLFSEVKVLKDSVTLKSLAIISFFSRIDKNNREFCDGLFKQLDIDECQFWEICYSLHESELVDLFEQQVVKISDQIFATYIFYKAVIEKETLSFSLFLNNYLDYVGRIKDTVAPLVNTFNSNQLETKLKPIILAKWIDIEKEGNYQNSLKYLDIFWFYLCPQVITFIKKQIDNNAPIPISEFRYNFKHNEFSNGVGEELEILSHFRYHENNYFKDALELLFYYAIRVPSKMPAIVYIIKEKFCFSRLGYMHGDRIQHLLLEFLIDKSKSDPNSNVYENVLSEILPDFLKIEFQENEGNGRGIYIYTFHLWLTESVKSFREKCFNYLLQDAKKENVLQVLYRLNFYEYKNSDDILLNDKSYIFKIISKHFKTDEFADCFILQHILDGFDWLSVDYSNEINKEYKSSLYQLAEVLKRDRQRKRELGWEEEEKLHQEELLEYCRGFNINHYISLLTNVSLISEQLNKVGRDNLGSQYLNSLSIILGNLTRTDKDLFLEVLNINFNGFRFNLNYIYIFNCFFQVTPQYYYELYKVIKEVDENIKFCFHQTVDVENVNDNHLELLYSDIITLIQALKTQYIFWDLTFISKYKKVKPEKEIYFEFLEIILNKIKIEEVNIGVGKHFIDKCITFYDFPFEMIVDAYLYTNRFDQYFDYENKILKYLLQKDPKIIIKLIKFDSSNKYSHYTFEHKNFDFIWELECYDQIITSVFEYFSTIETYYFFERVISAFFPQSNDKFSNRPIDFLKSLINKKHKDEKCMNLVFSIICHNYPVQKMDFLESFLILNSNLEIFKRLEIIPRSHTWSGSFIPILEREKQICSDVISVLDQLPNRLNYFEHKEYISRQIVNYDKRIKEEMKREFYDEFL